MTFRQDLEAALGQQVSFDPQQARVYDHDLGEMPSVLMSQLRAVPVAVAVPRAPEQVASALQVAARHGVPVTPRGQGSSGYGGSIPTRGGLVLDLTAMTRVAGVDAEACTVDVEPGVVWAELERTLARSGLAVRLMPTSGPSSTVGGWFAMGGVGIGSMRYGSIADTVIEADVAGLDGAIRTLSGPALELHHQTCGTLGVITRLRLRCRRATPLRSFAVQLDDAAGVESLLAELPRRVQPYSTAVCSAGYLSLRGEAEGHAAPLSRGFLALVTVEDDPQMAARVAAVVASARGRLLPDDVAAHEWAGRFYPMRMKKMGPALLVGEFYLPRERFAQAWQRIERALARDRFGLEAFGVQDGRLAVLIYVVDQGPDLLFPVRMSKVTLPISIAKQLGGSLYAPGLWFGAEARRFLGSAKHDAWRAEKDRLDPSRLLNPGKLERVLPRWFPAISLSWAIGVGSALAAPLGRLLPSRRRPPAARNPAHAG